MMSLFSTVFKYLKETPKSRWNYVASFVFRLCRVKVKGKRGNRVILANTYARNLKVVFEGKGNLIDFSEGANYIQDSSIYIHGDDNRIIIGTRNYMEKLDLYIEDNNNAITFGNRNRVFGKTHVACIEGTEVSFGDGCLFSDKVVFRTGDSHAIFDLETNERINPSKSIKIGDRVWFGNSTTILKGVAIGDGSIVGTGAIVTSEVESNCIVAGIPAKVVKRGVKWNLQRVNK